MVERAAPPDVQGTLASLSGDSALFDMYMSALDSVLEEPEIRSALDDLSLSGATLRMKMVGEAEQVLSAAPQEDAEYKAVSSVELGYRDTAEKLPPEVEAIRRELNRLLIGAAAAGLIMAVGGEISWGLWPLARMLVWAGATGLVVALMLWLVPKALLGTDFGYRLLRGDGSPALAAARDRLIAAVTDVEVLAQARLSSTLGARTGSATSTPLQAVRGWARFTTALIGFRRGSPTISLNS